MKLTDEMREAALTARHAAHALGESRTDAVFAAGYRMGQQAMRERAAKEAFTASDKNDSDLVLFGVLRLLGSAIKSIPTEE